MTEPVPGPAPAGDLDAVRRELHERLLATFDFESFERLGPTSSPPAAEPRSSR